VDTHTKRKRAKTKGGESGKREQHRVRGK